MELSEQDVVVSGVTPKQHDLEDIAGGEHLVELMRRGIYIVASMPIGSGNDDRPFAIQGAITDQGTI